MWSPISGQPMPRFEAVRHFPPPPMQSFSNNMSLVPNRHEQFNGERVDEIRCLFYNSVRKEFNISLLHIYLILNCYSSVDVIILIVLFLEVVCNSYLHYVYYSLS